MAALGNVRQCAIGEPCAARNVEELQVGAVVGNLDECLECMRVRGLGEGKSVTVITPPFGEGHRGFQCGFFWCWGGGGGGIETPELEGRVAENGDSYQDGAYQGHSWGIPGAYTEHIEQSLQNTAPQEGAIHGGVTFH